METNCNHAESILLSTLFFITSSACNATKAYFLYHTVFINITDVSTFLWQDFLFFDFSGTQIIRLIMKELKEILLYTAKERTLYARTEFR